MLQFREIEYAVLEELRHCTGGSLAGRKILDIGCGVGGWIREFVKWGADPESLYGIDAIADRLEEARRLSPSGVHFICGNAARMEFPDGFFDLIMMFQSMCLMLEDNARQMVARQALRVLKPGGAILLYDYRYRRPQLGDVLRPVSKREIKRLFPSCRYRIRAIHPFPPLARRLAAVSPLGWKMLNLFPPLRTSYFGSIQKPFAS
ncbi:MAG TPA: class I SAM-dependent methyltransferase [Candidatus Binataceae bacterium]|nr:class I SAM-dependent methyltransferase [Candidatus Binataceae bacterium]